MVSCCHACFSIYGITKIPKYGILIDHFHFRLLFLDPPPYLGKIGPEWNFALAQVATWNQKLLVYFIKIWKLLTKLRINFYFEWYFVVKTDHFQLWKMWCRSTWHIPFTLSPLFINRFHLPQGCRATTNSQFTFTH